MEDLIEINLTESDPIIGVIYLCFFARKQLLFYT